MSISAFKYNQNDQEYISFIISFEKLNHLSTVLIYQKHTDGYQREPNPSHITSIKKYIINNIKNFKLPTSIMLGVDKATITKFLKIDNGEVNLEIDDIEEKLFRIVDGQHRVLGMLGATKDLKDADNISVINNYKFNVVCILSEENNRSVELEIFIDINSKGKKVSTDLAELAKYSYQVKEGKIPKEIGPLSENIALKASRELRERNKESVWYYAIKFDIHSEVNLGIIGVSAFRQSITGIVQKYIRKFRPEILTLDDSSFNAECDKIALTTQEFISRCWDEVILKKWRGCFADSSVKDDEGELISIKFSNNYYIQKPLGTKSINKIIEDLLDENDTLENTFKAFEEKIQSSQVKNEDWLTGRTFAGLNSEGGFKKIREMILNHRPIPIN